MLANYFEILRQKARRAGCINESQLIRNPERPRVLTPLIHQTRRFCGLSPRLLTRHPAGPRGHGTPAEAGTPLRLLFSATL